MKECTCNLKILVYITEAIQNKPNGKSVPWSLFVLEILSFISAFQSLLKLSLFGTQSPQRDIERNQATNFNKPGNMHSAPRVYLHLSLSAKETIPIKEISWELFDVKSIEVSNHGNMQKLCAQSLHSAIESMVTKALIL